MNKKYAFVTLAIVTSFCLWLSFLNTKTQREHSQTNHNKTTVSQVPQPIITRISVAHIGKDSNILLTCSDFVVTVPAGTEMPSLYQEMVTSLLAMEGIVAVPQVCHQQFADRTVWAMCAHRGTRNDGVAIEWTERHYSHSTVYDTDQTMSECLSSGGMWTAASRDTHEWRRESRRIQMENLQRDLERSQADMDAIMARRRY